MRRWLPELSESWEPVELHHLLAHTSGLANGIAIDSQSGWGVSSDMTTWDRIAIIATQSPESPPGIVHRYSNHGYVLLAGIVERAADERFGDFARSALFEPSGMTDSRFLDTTGIAPVPGWIGGKDRVDVQLLWRRRSHHHTDGPSPMGRMATNISNRPAHAERTARLVERTSRT